MNFKANFYLLFIFLWAGIFSETEAQQKIELPGYSIPLCNRPRGESSLWSTHYLAA